MFAFMKPNLTPVENLNAMGFRKCGDLLCGGDKLKCNFSEDSKAPNVLYAFVSANAVLYIGKTTRSLKKRVYGYENPGPTQSTNIKVNKFIKETLVKGDPVEIHALADNGLLEYGGFHVNLAAGLEDSMIAKLKPKWNKGKGMTSTQKVDAN
jgi:hypothetical protein